MKNLDLLVPTTSKAGSTWTWATVMSTGPLRIRLDGDSDSLGITPECLFANVQVEQRVWVQITGKKVVVHAPAGGAGDPTAANLIGNPDFDALYSDALMHNGTHGVFTANGVEDWHFNSLFGAYATEGSKVEPVTDRVATGSHALRATWPTKSATEGGWVGRPASGFIVGETYTWVARVWIPAGQSVRMDYLWYQTSDPIATFGQWATVSQTFTAREVDCWLGFVNRDSVSGSQFWVDEVKIYKGAVNGFVTPAKPIEWSQVGSNDAVAYVQNDPRHVYAGAQSVRVELPPSSATSPVARLTSTAFAVSGGEILTVRARAKASSSLTSMDLSLLSTSDGHEPLPTDSPSVTRTRALAPLTSSIPTEWTTFERTVIVPKGETLARLSIAVGGNASTAARNAYLDTISVTRTKAESTAGLAILFPTGVVQAFAGQIAPQGYALCRGQEVSRTDPEYAALFAITGVMYGAGNGSTTFNLPNLKGRVIVGVDPGQAEFDVQGETGGAKTHTLTTSEMPAHKHDASADSDGSHSHSMWSTTTVGTSANAFVRSTGTRAAYAGSMDTAGAHSHALNIGDTGGGAAHNNLQPYQTLQYIIKL